MAMSVSNVECERLELAPAAALFRSLGDQSRLAIVRRLAEGPARVGDLVAAVGLAQSTVSKHLGGIVKLFENYCGAVDVSCFGGQI